MFRLNRNAVLCILCFVFFLTGINQSRAFLNEGEYTPAEKIGFAFNKIAHTTPKYEKWVRYSERYTKAPEAERSIVMQEQTYRLEKGFGLFNLDEDLIKLSTVAHINFTAADGSRVKTGKDGTPVHMNIKVNESGKIYFPVEIGNSWVAVIPSDTGIFNPVKIDENVYQQFRKYADNENSYKVVRLKLWFRPDNVDNKTPMTLENKPMWLMMGRIANAEIWDIDSKNMIWEHSEPWYTSDHTKDLLDMYQDAGPSR